MDFCSGMRICGLEKGWHSRFQLFFQRCEAEHSCHGNGAAECRAAFHEGGIRTEVIRASRGWMPMMKQICIAVVRMMVYNNGIT